MTATATVAKNEYQRKTIYLVANSGLNVSRKLDSILLSLTCDIQRLNLVCSYCGYLQRCSLPTFYLLQPPSS